MVSEKRQVTGNQDGDRLEVIFRGSTWKASKKGGSSGEDTERIGSGRGRGGVVGLMVVVRHVRWRRVDKEIYFYIVLGGRRTEGMV